MKIQGTQQMNVEVDIAPRDVYWAFLEHLRVALFPDPECRPLGQQYNHNSVYIDNRGVWIRWEDGRGLGYTTEMRKATPEEVEGWARYEAVRNMRSLF